MDLSKLMSLLLSKGVNYVIAQLPGWISRKEVSREDAELILTYAMMSKLDDLGKKIDGLGNKMDELGKKIDARFDELGRKIDDLRREIDSMHKEMVDRLDFISNQLRVLNSNIAATYELTSKAMTRLMESSIAPTRT
ncbi:hypothetical protein [Vulcanisaeta distributa]|uniref:Uncharacterized protein n=1 Tax=Vulcanisaeta distributa (strain DSM 14429 / JCM 11212 / NBRC 100878 / IC-017) TaxID=572478 RepID=E1QQL6_VULDI|nr:hypothetical protein [Vulcanisaeta distributa]ADN50511.1 conserved hypothetical protein [Vulcanisaeta distributa DSM 14429]